ncbi:MAG: hypothetical protein U5L05_05440, partial [Rubrivivax sp.]|nr:hypothetical protein [Rubrivivax sp.]
ASNPLDRKDPLAPTNRRISVVVMTREAEERVFTGGRLLQQAASIVPDLGTVVATTSTASAGQPGHVDEPGR